jgi:acyl-CoA synthetase (AMP-forming)/AMP-acid ligase II
MIFERFTKLIQGMFLFDENSVETLGRQFEKHAANKPQKLFLLYHDRTFTYAEANSIINRYANAYKSLGLEKGDVVALDIENRPEFYWHFFALNKIGVVASLINTNTTGDVLIHALRVCEPRNMVIGSEVWSHFAEIRDKVADVAPGGIYLDVDPEQPVAVDLPKWSDRAADASEENPLETDPPTLSDAAAYIYTSGTTGMPKPAVIKNHRFYRAGRVWGALSFRYEDTDILYNCLPLYHSNGLMLGSGSAVTYGITVALSRKFSASRFWDEVRKYDATAFMYIGELCRYLLNQPPSDLDRQNKVRVISGNGLRAEIWEEFRSRFDIDRVSEWYAATEGNAITINFTGVVGAVGKLMPTMAVVRWDEDRQDFVRTKKGFLQKTRFGEPGVLVAEITPRYQFDGYRDQKATESKIIRDAFKKGDAWFDTGDMLRCDWRYNLYFVDRLGDTFRWKGENVATFEVEQEICKLPQVREANVYGVQIAGTEGRAGMVSLVLEDGAAFDPAAFRNYVDSTLPVYARPVFIRLRESLEATSTFKIKKTSLQKEGYDPSMVSDPLYFRRPDSGEYVPISKELYRDLATRKLRL